MSGGVSDLKYFTIHNVEKWCTDSLCFFHQIWKWEKIIPAKMAPYTPTHNCSVTVNNSSRTLARQVFTIVTPRHIDLVLPAYTRRCELHRKPRKCICGNYSIKMPPIKHSVHSRLASCLRGQPRISALLPCTQAAPSFGNSSATQQQGTRGLPATRLHANLCTQENPWILSSQHCTSPTSRHLSTPESGSVELAASSWPLATTPSSS